MIAQCLGGLISSSWASVINGFLSQHRGPESRNLGLWLQSDCEAPSAMKGLREMAIPAINYRLTLVRDEWPAQQF